MKTELRKWFFNYKSKNVIQLTDLVGEVPCSFYSILVNHNIIKDPYYKDYEYDAFELSYDDCEMYCVFHVDKAILGMQHLFLRFHGIDTLADIYLNHEFLGYADNMHRIWEYDVKKHMIIGDNIITLKFKSPMNYIKEKENRYPLGYALDPEPGFAHIRKPHYMFGWDWGPKLPDMGLSREVELIGYEDTKINDVFIRQFHDKDKVRLQIRTELSNEVESELELQITITNPQKDSQMIRTSFKGVSMVASDIIISNPKLWWPNGLGEQSLYTIEVAILKNCEVLDCDQKRIGLRTLTVSTDKDCWGNEFCFKINGQKIFSMGADYIPQDNILSRVSRDKTEALIKDCIEANFNTIRVWGGGYYPEDYFYDLCDEYGLIVWQDFMFACCRILMKRNVEENLTAEFIDNIRRLRNHPSLGLLCGNNEMEWQWFWGDFKDQRLTADYLYLFDRLLPDLCNEYAPDTFYWPASPSSGGGFDEPNSYNKGDVHYWDVWHGEKPFEEFGKYYFRYCSEFGFQSFPGIKTIKTFAEDEDMNIFSKVMESHQKNGAGNTKILTYASQNYLYAKDFESLVYTSQLLQADAIRYGVEHWRRHRGRCMGAIYWQLNDCWPVASWASRDYYGRWKALHYSAKKFYAPILLSAHKDEWKVILNISNETWNAFSGKIVYGIYDNTLNEIHKSEMSSEVNQFSSKDIITLDLDREMKGHEDTRYLVYSLYHENGKLISKNTCLFIKPKHFKFKKPNIKTRIFRDDVTIKIEVEADVFAKSIELEFEDLDLQLSDNYFDICDKEKVIITIQNQQNQNINMERLKEEMSVKCIYHISN